jgi:hypothetical protein
VSVLSPVHRAATIRSVSDDDGLTPDDIRAIILAIMRIEEKLDALFGEDDDDGEEEDLA